MGPFFFLFSFFYFFLCYGGFVLWLLDVGDFVSLSWSVVVMVLILLVGGGQWVFVDIFRSIFLNATKH